MDVQEVRKLDAYLRRLLGSARIRLVPRPKKDETAEVYLGEEALGILNVDDEDGDRSYNVRIEIDLGEAADDKPAAQLTSYLRRKFDNEKIRVVPRPKKDDSLEVYVGEEFIGVLFIENERGRKSYILELPILDVDLVD